MEFLLAVAGQATSTAVSYAWMLPILLIAELLFPMERQSLISRLQGAVFLLAALPFTALTTNAFSLAWSYLGIEPLLSARLAIGSPALRFVVATALGMLIVDFAFYWRHRAQHAFFWRFHAVHHSIEEMNAVAHYHHPSEELFRVLLTAIPMSLLVDANTTTLGSMILTFHGIYLHSCTRLNMGPLRWLIGDNRFHRIHHSTNPAHLGKNFSGFLPIWDVVFGTAYFPKRDEWPKTGLADQPEPQSVAAYFAAPFVGSGPGRTAGLEAGQS